MNTNLNDIRDRLQKLADGQLIEGEQAAVQVTSSGTGLAGVVEIIGPNLTECVLGASGASAEQMLQNCALMLRSHRIVASRMPYAEFARRVREAVLAELPKSDSSGNAETETGVYLWHLDGKHAQLQGTANGLRTRLHIWTDTYNYTSNLVSLDNLSLQSTIAVILQHLKPNGEK